MRYLYFLPMMFFCSACIGPKVSTCVVLNDLKTEHCVSYDPKIPDMERPVAFGDVCYSQQDWAILMHWISDHKR